MAVARRRRRRATAGVAMLVAVLASCNSSPRAAAPTATPVSTTTATPATTTTPATTAPATTTTPVSTTESPSTTPPTSTIAPDLSIDALASWPDPPLDIPDLADVPLLLPSPTLVGTAMRAEYADDPATMHNYTQIWFGGEPAGPILTIETDLDQGPAVDGEHIVLGPWDRAFFTRMAPGYTQLLLQDPSGTVSIWSHGLTREDILAIATSMRPRTNGQPGWIVDQLPTGFIAVADAWILGVASRSVQWTGADGLEVAEMWIARGAPSTFMNPWYEGTRVSVFDIDGVPAVAYELDDRSAVVWSPQPDVTVLIALYAPVADSIAAARSVAPVGTTTWQSIPAVGTSTLDGCSSMFC